MCHLWSIRSDITYTYTRFTAHVHVHVYHSEYGRWIGSSRTLHIHAGCQLKTHFFLLVHWKPLGLNLWHPTDVWEWSHSTGFLELVDYHYPNCQITVGKNERVYLVKLSDMKVPNNVLKGTCTRGEYSHIYIHTLDRGTLVEVLLSCSNMTDIFTCWRSFLNSNFFLWLGSIEFRWYRALYLECFLVCSIWKKRPCRWWLLDSPEGVVRGGGDDKECHKELSHGR